MASERDTGGENGADISSTDGVPEIEQYKDINNNLVVPAYRRFCRDNGLDFHFWDELPEDAFDLKISGREFELHKEAMELFNRLKPEYHLFQNQIVTFRFSSWAGDFDYETHDVHDFLRDHARLQAMVKEQELQIGVLANVMLVLLVVVAFGFTFIFPIITLWIALPSSIILGFGLAWWLRQRPIKSKLRESWKFQERLEQIRQKLAVGEKVSKIKKTGLAETAQPKLAEALAEHILSREHQEPGDEEHRRYVLADINSLLLSAGPGAEVEPWHLDSPSMLRMRLRDNLEIPAQVLAKELPNRLQKWLKAEPPTDDLLRAEWVEQGRFLLDQARLNPNGSD